MKRSCCLNPSLLAFAVLVLAVALVGCPRPPPDSDSAAVAPGAHGLPTPDSVPSGEPAQPAAASLTSDAAESSEPPTATPPETQPAEEPPADEPTADCRSNMKQLGLGLMMYVCDYDERHPPAGKWCDVIAPYLKNESLHRCPADDSDHSYAINSTLGLCPWAEVRVPAATILLFESSTGKRNAADAGDSLCDPPRHAEGNNFTYVDGHVALAEGAQDFALDAEWPEPPRDTGAPPAGAAGQRD